VRKYILASILAVVLCFVPWRLGALLAETFVVHPGLTRVVQTNSRYWDVAILQERIEELGYPVKYTKGLTVQINMFQMMPVYGVTRKDDGKVSIEVEADLSWDARYAILAHEGGHIFQSEIYSGPEGEAFAEAVAMLVSHDGIREHARYLSNKKWALFTIVALDSARIYRAAAVLQE
jgi:hypothetical protein